MISTENPELLEVANRDELKLNSRNALKRGEILGIIYGKNIKNNIKVIFSKVKFHRILDKTGEGTLIKLKIEKEKNPRDVIIQDIQYHTYLGDVVHVDFMAVSLEEEVEVEVPVILEGISPAVKDLGGILVQNIESVEVRCKAKDIPKAISVNISNLKAFDDVISLKDIQIPGNVELLDNTELVVAMVDEPRSEKEMEELEEETQAADVSKVEGVEKEAEEASKEGEEKTQEIKTVDENKEV